MEQKELNNQIQKSNNCVSSTKRKLDEMTNKYEEEERSLTVAYEKLAFFKEAEEEAERARNEDE